MMSAVRKAAGADHVLPSGQDENCDMEVATEGEIDQVVEGSRADGTVRFTVDDISHMADTLLSEPTIIRSIPWRIMLMRKQNFQRPDHLSFYVQCSPTELEHTTWTCLARATLTLVNQQDQSKNFSRRLNHVFCGKENDWGFSLFISWEDLLDESKGWVKNNQAVFEAIVHADPPHGVSWDSKRFTGFVGLRNQGATCYMNSLLQLLFCTNELRRAVYQMPTESDDMLKSVPLAMQRVFFELQHNQKAVHTKRLTKSFGWESYESFLQHDVQEFSRVLLDNLEDKMKGTSVEGTIPRLFEGKMESYIKCTKVDYTSSRMESFMDIQLNIKGKKNVYESFDDYIAVENLDGDNKYDAEKFGMQEARKGVIFISLPPVLHLQLMRFQYDPSADSNVKINDRYEFPEKLCLDKYLKESEVSEETPARYTLHGVLVHSGDNNGGHYVAYVNPKCSGGQWVKFDDDVVSLCSRKEAIEETFGGPDEDDRITARSCTNAYMLAYIRDDCLTSVLKDVTNEDIPEALVNRLHQEKQLEERRRREKEEAHLYLRVQLFLTDDFYCHHGNDLLGNHPGRMFKVRKDAHLPELMELIANVLGRPKTHIRLWPFITRSNKTLRPSVIEKDDINKAISQIADRSNPWQIFVETLDLDETSFPETDPDHHFLLFFKFYDPLSKTLSYAGHMIVHGECTLSSLEKSLWARIGLPRNTPLLFYEEVKPNFTEELMPDQQLNQIEEAYDGDIICFQRGDVDTRDLDQPTVCHYFRDLFHRIEVNFRDVSVLSDDGFQLTLSQRMRYHQFSREVSHQLDFDANKLQFFKPHSYQRNAHGNPVRHDFDGLLRELLGGQLRAGQPPTLYYKRLTIPLKEYENKDQYRVVFVNAQLQDEKELQVLVDKGGTVCDLLKQASLDIKATGTKVLRLMEISGSRIHSVLGPETPLENIRHANQLWRVEEIPKEELSVSADTEAVVPVAHFDKTLLHHFGTPFFTVIKDKQTVASLREQLRKRLDVSERDFDLYKLAVVSQGRPKYLADDGVVRKSDFYQCSYHKTVSPQSPFLGLDHPNRASKRMRTHFPERAIKIHN